MKLRDILPLEKWVGNNSEVEIQNLGLVNTKLANSLTFAESAVFAERAMNSPAIVGLILSPDQNVESEVESNKAIILHSNPRKLFFSVHNYLAEHTNFYGNIACVPSRVSPTARIADTAYVSAHNVIIEDDVVVEPHAVIFEGVTIGRASIVRAGTVIGSEGFEHKRVDDEVLSVKHAGTVVIGEDVHIGSNCCIDRAVFRERTVIGNSTKIDNMVHIAHGVQIGQRVFIAASAEITGRVEIGDDAWIGPNATISHQLTIGNNASITLGSVVVRNVKPGQKVSGNFAVSHEEFLRETVELHKIVKRATHK